MKKSSLVLMLAAGAAVSGAASAQVAEAIRMHGNVAPARHAYVNLATGEWTFDVRPAGTRVGDFDVFNNGHTPVDPVNGPFGFFHGQDDATRTGTITALGTEVISWGDCELSSSIDQIEIQYATNIVDDATPGVVGLDAIIRLYDQDGGNVDGAAVTTAEITIEDIPGNNTTFAFGGWFVTADLATPVVLGDTAANGLDLDEDGRADIGFAYRFAQNQSVAKGTIGPIITMGGNHGGWFDLDFDGVVDKGAGVDYPLGSAGTSDTLWHWTNGPTTLTAKGANLASGAWRFGGNPSAGGSRYMVLRGPVACDPILDLNGDGAFDLGDFFNFLGRFDIAGG